MMNDLSAEEISYALNRASGFKLPLAHTEPVFVFSWIKALHKELFVDTHFAEPALSLARGDKLFELITQLVFDFNIVKFAQEFITSQPFAYGNSLTLRIFLVEICKTPDFQAKFPQGLDFRRIPIAELNSDSVSKLITAALNKSHDNHSPLRYESWPPFPSSEVVVSGYRFLVFTDNYFVTLDGGIVHKEAVAKELEQFLISGGHPSDFTIAVKHIERYISTGKITEIDFGGHVPLFCLDTDYLTGLLTKTELPIFSHELIHQRLTVLDVPDSQYNHPVVIKAAPRIAALRPLILNAVQSLFENKTPVLGRKPKFFMSMGGIGSGKSHLEKYARTVTDNNVVFASIDLARQYSNIMELYWKCHQHSDDYKSLAMLTYVIMGEVINVAIAGRYNYFRDSTGIPYEGRNSGYIKIMKIAGYETYVIAAAAPIYIMPDRTDLNEPVHERVIRRFEKYGRAVPWNIVISKNVQYPLAQMQAAQDIYLDHLLVFDTMTPRNQTYILAKTYNVTVSQLNRIMMTMADSSSLTALLHEYQLLPLEIGHDYKNPQDLLDVKVTAKSQGHFKIIVSLNKIRMLDIIQKGLLNPNAQGYEELLLNTCPYHIPALDFPNDGRGEENSWKLRLQKVE